jgi:hypothetical protein
MLVDKLTTKELILLIQWGQKTQKFKGLPFMPERHKRVNKYDSRRRM